ncbi:MAG: hypothetical protein CMQ38_09940 [Gammaproteobacteria bacterium]|nr:hypothetical protein [Gammaproteobacteria bacterium]
MSMEDFPWNKEPDQTHHNLDLAETEKKLEEVRQKIRYEMDIRSHPHYGLTDFDPEQPDIVLSE